MYCGVRGVHILYTVSLEALVEESRLPPTRLPSGGETHHSSVDARRFVGWLLLEHIIIKVITPVTIHRQEKHADNAPSPKNTYIRIYHLVCRVCDYGAGYAGVRRLNSPEILEIFIPGECRSFIFPGYPKHPWNNCFASNTKVTTSSGYPPCDGQPKLAKTLRIALSRRCKFPLPRLR